jgi:hypothetical protein
MVGFTHPTAVPFRRERTGSTIDPACSNKGHFFLEFERDRSIGRKPMTALDKDQVSEGSSRRVWWFEGFWEEFR